MSERLRAALGSLLAAAAVALLAHSPSGAYEARPDPERILEESDRARGGGLPGIRWQVDVVAADGGDVTEQRLVVTADNDNSLVEFREPPNVAGQKMLMSGRNMWFLRSGLRRPVPISPRQRLLGQAATGDVAATDYAGDYKARLDAIEEVEGVSSYRLDLRARNNHVTYPRIRYWVAVASGLAVKAEFFTVSGRVYKAATFEYGNRIEYANEHIPFVSKMVIEDLINRDRRTTLIYSDVAVVDLPRRTFDLNFLVR